LSRFRILFSNILKRFTALFNSSLYATFSRPKIKERFIILLIIRIFRFRRKRKACELGKEERNEWYFCNKVSNYSFLSTFLTSGRQMVINRCNRITKLHNGTNFRYRRIIDDNAKRFSKRKKVSCIGRVARNIRLKMRIMGMYIGVESDIRAKHIRIRQIPAEYLSSLWYDIRDQHGYISISRMQREAYKFEYIADWNTFVTLHLFTALWLIKTMIMKWKSYF